MVVGILTIRLSRLVHISLPYSAVEIMTDRQPHTPVDLTVWSGPDLKNVNEMRLPAARADTCMNRLTKSLSLMHEHVQCTRQRPTRSPGKGDA